MAGGAASPQQRGAARRRDPQSGAEGPRLRESGAEGDAGQGSATRWVPPGRQAPPAARRGEGARWAYGCSRYLGTQLGLEPSISQVAKRFIGTGRPKAPAPPGKLRRPRSAAAAIAAGLACAHRAAAAAAAGCAAAPPRRGGVVT